MNERDQYTMTVARMGGLRAITIRSKDGYRLGFMAGNRDVTSSVAALERRNQLRITVTLGNKIIVMFPEGWGV